MPLNDIFDPLIILAALLCGMVSRAIGLPALIGYLAAGFVLHEVDLLFSGVVDKLKCVSSSVALWVSKISEKLTGS